MNEHDWKTLKYLSEARAHLADARRCLDAAFDETANADRFCGTAVHGARVAVRGAAFATERAIMRGVTGAPDA